MRMRLEFDLDEDAWSEEDFAAACNALFETLDATSCYFGRVDPPGPQDPDAGVLGAGNSAYTTAEGGEVNSQAATDAARAAQQAQEDAEAAAQALAQGRSAGG